MRATVVIGEFELFLIILIGCLTSVWIGVGIGYWLLGGPRR